MIANNTTIHTIPKKYCVYPIVIHWIPIFLAFKLQNAMFHHTCQENYNLYICAWYLLSGI